MQMKFDHKKERHLQLRVDIRRRQMSTRFDQRFDQFEPANTSSIESSKTKIPDRVKFM